LVGLPFYDRRLERRPWKRPISVGIFVAIFLALGFFGLQSHHEDMNNPGVAAQLQRQRHEEEEFMKAPFEAEVVMAGAPTAPVNPGVAEGQAIFVRQGCNACHGDGGVGGGIGPRLVGVSAKYDSPKIQSLLRSPTPAMLAGGMPPVDIKQDELDQLTGYLQSLK
jgi:mono/diheme cytochrome c family protein